MLAIDPGQYRSGYVLWDGATVIDKSLEWNDVLLELIYSSATVDYCAIEWPRGMGQTAGNELLDTAIFAGRFAEAASRSGMKVIPVPRREVKMYLVGAATAKDKNIRDALIDRFGPPGTKKSQGTLYGVTSHMMAALAVAVTAWDKIESENAPELSQDARRRKLISNQGKDMGREN